MFLKKIDRLIGSLLIRVLRGARKNVPSPVCISKLLIIRPGGIGDAVLLIPSINRLLERFPNACIDVLAERRNAQAFVLCAGIGRVFCYDKPADLLAIIRAGYDVVIDSEQWYRLSAVVAQSTCAPLTIGYGTNERKKLFTHAIDYRQDEYELKVFFDLLTPLGLNALNVVTSGFLSVPGEVRVSVDAILEPLEGASFVVLFPGTSVNEKNWGVVKFRELALRLSASGYSVVVVGGKDDAEAGASIAAGVGAINLAGRTTLSETAAILKRSLLLVSGDSGVLHMGAGVGAATVALFGPSNASKWAPRGKDHIVVSQHLACSPCSHFGVIPPCSIGVKCIRDITVDDVYEAVRRALNVRKGLVSFDER